MAITALAFAGAGVFIWSQKGSEPERSVIYACPGDSNQAEGGERDGFCPRYGNTGEGGYSMPMLPGLNPDAIFRARAATVAPALIEAICAWEDSPCMTRRPATEDDAERVYQVLRDKGLVDVRVRLARPADPAPPGALMYALFYPQRCIAAYVDFRESPVWKDISHLLPNGRCPAP